MFITLVNRFTQIPNVVKALTLQQFLEGFTPIMALYAIMFERVGHLSFGHIGWLFSIWSVAYLLVELPSGVLADRWSRKKVVVVGGLLRAAGFAFWLLRPGFWGYAIGFALWGAMIACSSGAVSALLHSELRAIGQGKSFAKYFGWTMSAYFFGSLVGYGVAAVLTLDRVNVLIIISLLSSITYAVVLGLTPEHPYKKQASYIQTLVAGIKELKHSRYVSYLCFLLFSVYMIIGTLEELIPRLYANFGLGDTAVALFGVVVLLVTTLLLARLEKFIKLSIAGQVFAMVVGLIIFIVAMCWGGLGASLLVLVFNLLFHILRPVFMHHVQDSVVGEERATVSSIPGLAAGLMSALAYIAIGKVAEHTSESFSMGLYAAVWVALLLAALFAGRHNFRPVEQKASVPSI